MAEIPTLSLSLSKFMAENPAFSLSNPCQKPNSLSGQKLSPLSLSLSTLVENPTLSLIVEKN